MNAKHKLKCGCIITLPTYDEDWTIEYCSLHAAAPEIAEALTGLANWKMRDGSLCFCVSGRHEDDPQRGSMPTIHSTACEQARAVLAKVDKG